MPSQTYVYNNNVASRRAHTCWNPYLPFSRRLLVSSKFIVHNQWSAVATLWCRRTRKCYIKYSYAIGIGIYYFWRDNLIANWHTVIELQSNVNYPISFCLRIPLVAVQMKKNPSNQLIRGEWNAMLLGRRVRRGRIRQRRLLLLLSPPSSLPSLQFSCSCPYHNVQYIARCEKYARRELLKSGIVCESYCCYCCVCASVLAYARAGTCGSRHPLRRLDGVRAQRTQYCRGVRNGEMYFEKCDHWFIDRALPDTPHAHTVCARNHLTLERTQNIELSRSVTRRY